MHSNHAVAGHELDVTHKEVQAITKYDSLERSWKWGLSLQRLQRHFPVAYDREEPGVMSGAFVWRNSCVVAVAVLPWVCAWH